MVVMASTEVRATALAKVQTKFHTTKLQKQYMVEWIEKPHNFDVIVGRVSEDASKQFGGAQTKIAVFGDMSLFVFHSCIEDFGTKGLSIPVKYTVKWDAATCQSRWNSYFKVYKKPKLRVDAQTGFGLSEQYFQDGKTLEDAVEEACPFYYRLDQLFGLRQNVRPHSVLDSHSLSTQTSLISPQSPLVASNFEREGSSSFDEPILTPSLSFELAQNCPSSDSVTPSFSFSDEDEESETANRSTCDEASPASPAPSETRRDVVAVDERPLSEPALESGNVVSTANATVAQSALARASV
ncbi:hypothetical protein PF005_g18963 [Phytophthora fragariae]|uniref:Uncharacterized protein n=1 Tax=Phytophthora fragariae TaxID=53985 RepID=A0A6A3JEH1_9STRA|nr:hypothetical protein PF003_g3672 [Phytophthora fragariae]KAE8929367.1 hypothetical protein PF009_g20514 [Phytophthora fragariae]KAE8989923.1 hypothetical protein PF011_g18569 [Phytophthora fragariae]KAE9089590.1 hypothetical protein PF007_g19543 [Phytophthora fragariae]KAE9091250.1 hypothetical protein PF010_g18261 [Phytophthora fragariae]